MGVRLSSLLWGEILKKNAPDVGEIETQSKERGKQAPLTHQIKLLVSLLYNTSQATKSPLLHSLHNPARRLAPRQRLPPHPWRHHVRPIHLTPTVRPRDMDAQPIRPVDPPLSVSSIVVDVASIRLFEPRGRAVGEAAPLCVYIYIHMNVYVSVAADK